MISSQQLDNLVNNFDKLSRLAKDNKVDELALLQPLFSEEKKLHFVVSKKGQELSFNELTNIKRSLCNLLEIDFFGEDLFIKDRGCFREEYFQEDYGEILPLKEGITKEKITVFVREKLGFEYTPSTPSVSLNSSGGKERDKRERQEEPDIQGNSEKKQKGISSPFFSSVPQVSNNLLPSNIEVLLSKLEKELDSNPGYTSIVEKRISDKKAEQQRQQVIIGKG